MTAINLILLVCIVFLIGSVVLLRIRYRKDFIKISNHYDVVQYTQLNELFTTVYKNSGFDEKLMADLKKAASQSKVLLGGADIADIIDTVVLNSDK